MAVAVMAKLIRLDKYLVEMNKGSRTQIKDAAKKGRIQVNGVPEKKTERKIDPETDEVTFDSQPVSYRAMEYIMLYKPQGVISATEDKRHKTVIDLLSGENRSDLFPVGRLDIDTEGLLLLTNDGDLTHRLLAPGKHVDKVYFARKRYLGTLVLAEKRTDKIIGSTDAADVFVIYRYLMDGRSVDLYGMTIDTVNLRSNLLDCLQKHINITYIRKIFDDNLLICHNGSCQNTKRGILCSADHNISYQRIAAFHNILIHYTPL